MQLYNIIHPENNLSVPFSKRYLIRDDKRDGIMCNVHFSTGPMAFQIH